MEAELEKRRRNAFGCSDSAVQKRKTSAKRMEGLIEKELKELAFASATFVIDVKTGGCLFLRSR